MAARKTTRRSQQNKKALTKPVTARAKSAAKPAKSATAKPAKSATAKPAKSATAKPAKSAAKSTPAAKKQVAAKKPPVAKKSSKPAAPKRRPAPPRSTPARDARLALAKKKRIESILSPVDGKAVVDAYLRDVDHPYKAEMQAVREIILATSPKLAERIKWNAPSFYYKEDLAAFNPRATEYAHLILLFPGGAGLTNESWLEGKHKDRREAKFHSLDDVARKKPALQRLVKRWVALRDV